MLAAIWNAGKVIPRIPKSQLPRSEKPTSTPAITQHANLAIRMRSAGESCAVIARKTGTVENRIDDHKKRAKGQQCVFERFDEENPALFETAAQQKTARSCQRDRFLDFWHPPHTSWI
jgi:hypothetical protein